MINWTKAGIYFRLQAALDCLLALSCLPCASSLSSARPTARDSQRSRAQTARNSLGGTTRILGPWGGGLKAIRTVDSRRQATVGGPRDVLKLVSRAVGWLSLAF
ncbi:hypothetical protein F4802DRAFT_482876 [Xylaria palmicola]|nr:hypothetical protein F4802DRAFT_482876 [Xylaria palmicola]